MKTKSPDASPAQGDGAGKSSNKGLQHETWPALPSQRIWTFWTLLFVAITFSAATWAFPVGGVIALFLPLDLGFGALAAGTIIASVMVAVAAGPISSKYGLDTVGATRPVLGRGGSYITLILVVMVSVGWNTVLAILLGRSAAQILLRLDIIGEGALRGSQIAFTVLALVACMFLLRGGAEYLRNLGKWTASLVLIFATWLLVVLIGEVGWSELVNAQPTEAYPKQSTNFMIGLDVGLAPQLSFLPFLGALARLVPGMRRATWPLILGLSIPMIYLASIGLLAGLAVPDSMGDPSTFLPAVASTTTIVVLLIFTCIANIATIWVGAYVASVGLNSIPAVERRLKWTPTVILVLTPVAVLSVLWPDQVYDKVGTYMLYLGVAFAPLAGLMITDFHMMRRQRINLAAIYDKDPSRAYHYIGGFNPAGIISMIVGVVCYLYLLDPYALTVREPFSLISAGIPTAIISSLVYAGITRFYNIPRGMGGYRDPEPGSNG